MEDSNKTEVTAGHECAVDLGLVCMYIAFGHSSVHHYYATGPVLTYVAHVKDKKHITCAVLTKGTYTINFC